MSGNEQKYIQQAFDTNWIAPLGPHVDAFEREVAKFAGVKDAIAVNSGTSAIHLALQLLNVGKEDIIFCSTLTFIASANPIVYCGAEPVFIDSEPETWNMSPQALQQALLEAKKNRKMPKAIIVVHLYGQSAKMDQIGLICKEYGIPIIEDAAESLGSTYQGRASGSLGRFGIYSFNGNKIITTSGGGMLISNDTNAIKKARHLASQARDPAPYYQHSTLGYNYRLSNLLAGVGRAQLQVLNERIETRRNIFKLYLKQLSELPGFTFMPELANTRSNRWLTTLTMNEEEAGCSISNLLEGLAQENIEARPVWKPMHMQPIFKGTRYYSHDHNCNISEQLFRTGLCLPSGSNMMKEDQMRVIDFIKQIVAETSKKCKSSTFFVS